ncbi:protein enabled [Tripterygium wilfordii]|uniref:Protein enabled n=1 Tax=Tripterygium wilfordii TaxID=458696 RepID=A0A7J7C012_TRIWF|nr:protein enabled homolog [Tripterygium wilfordii]KAF5727474.1 protein enabled [Tripterygium wilfordii]
MDNQRSLLSWPYFCQGKTMDELRHSLVYTTLELEQTRLAVQEELRRRDEQLIYLKDLLTKAIKEKEETQEKCQRLLLDKILVQQQQQQQQLQAAAPLSGVSSIEDEPKRGIDSSNGFSSSDCEESIVSSPVFDPTHLTRPPAPAPAPAPPPPPSLPETDIELVSDKPLPEKGKLLHEVMKAGPLLQNLLLAGPLPQWRHPPPPLETFEIPPVTIPSPSQPPPVNASNTINQCGKVNKKRVLCDGSD